MEWTHLLWFCIWWSSAKVGGQGMPQLGNNFSLCLLPYPSLQVVPFPVGILETGRAPDPAKSLVICFLIQLLRIITCSEHLAEAETSLQNGIFQLTWICHHHRLWDLYHSSKSGALNQNHHQCIRPGRWQTSKSSGGKTLLISLLKSWISWQITLG